MSDLDKSSIRTRHSLLATLAKGLAILAHLVSLDGISYKLNEIFAFFPLHILQTVPMGGS
jgi:hypothetical protein